MPSEHGEASSIEEFCDEAISPQFHSGCALPGFEHPYKIIWCAVSIVALGSNPTIKYVFETSILIGVQRYDSG